MENPYFWGVFLRQNGGVGSTQPLKVAGIVATAVHSHLNATSFNTIRGQIFFGFLARWFEMPEKPRDFQSKKTRKEFTNRTTFGSKLHLKYSGKTFSFRWSFRSFFKCFVFFLGGLQTDWRWIATLIGDTVNGWAISNRKLDGVFLLLL